MTNQEAVKIVKRVKGIYAYESDYEALDMAIEALEKQVPVKPHYSILQYQCKGKIFKIKHPNCPRCRINGLYLWEAEIQKGNAYCHRCGQAMDWGDEDV